MNTPLHEMLAEKAKAVSQITDGKWTAENSEVYDEGCDAHPIISCECNTTCRSDEDQDQIARYITACQPCAVAELCEQVRVLLAAVQAVEDFISGKPDAPEPFGITRDALKFVKQGNT